MRANLQVAPESCAPHTPSRASPSIGRKVSVGLRIPALLAGPPPDSYRRHTAHSVLSESSGGHCAGSVGERRTRAEETSSPLRGSTCATVCAKVLAARPFRATPAPDVRPFYA